MNFFHEVDYSTKTNAKKYAPEKNWQEIKYTDIYDAKQFKNNLKEIRFRDV